MYVRTSPKKKIRARTLLEINAVVGANEKTEEDIVDENEPSASSTLSRETISQ